MNDLKKRPLFIYEMANNHMGDVRHGIRIVQELAQVSSDFPFNFAVKLQYRDLDTLIHPDFKQRMDVKYVKRFTETRLSWEQFKQIKDAIDEAGFLAVCTPFDEVSVEKIVEHGYDYLKIPSCSITDWPLLEKISRYNLPIIASTAGESLENIDRVVSFFRHREKQLSVMHCVGEYPAPDNHLHLGQISLLLKRYPGVEIGYSTHEHPDNFDAVKIAIARGATILEKHVAVPTEKYPVNGYSVTPEQVRKWLGSALDAYKMLGECEHRYTAPQGELRALGDLARGVFVKEPVAMGAMIKASNVFYAMPRLDGQIVAQDMSKYAEFVALEPIAALAPVMRCNVEKRDRRDLVHKIVHDVKALLKKSRAAVPGQVDLEISHHYGIDKFYQYGITMITVVNREYCKKLIVVLPNQSHPEQLHRIKEETYHVLYGNVKVDLDGSAYEKKAGDVLVIPRGQKHAFCSKSGCIIEEISSSHILNDSYYTDPAINSNGDRKTFVTYWMD
jgi:sialic acid synthase SpsE/quercetin dioxygenase-like cupin family protein